MNIYMAQKESLRDKQYGFMSQMNNFPDVKLGKLESCLNLRMINEDSPIKSYDGAFGSQFFVYKKD